MKSSTGQNVYEQIYSKILGFLSIKPRSENEVISKLSYYLKYAKSNSDEDPLEIKDRIIKQLREKNLLNDLVYSKSYVEECMRSAKGFSKTKIRMFLSKKGIPEDIQEKVLKLFTVDVEREKALKDAEKKMRGLSGVPVSVRKQKLFSYLKSRGYSYQVISSVVDTVVGVK